MHQYWNLDQALIGMSRVLLDKGKWRNVRGFNCLEIPHPVTIAITNPTDRYVTIPQRHWNKTLPWAESLWMALGLNDLNSLPGRYVRNLYTYSDDGRTWRGGYGPRIRAYSGVQTDYNITQPQYRQIFTGHVGTTDQLRYVVEALRRDINTRQAIIDIGDPAKDSFNIDNTLKETKDYPCSRILQFMVVDGKLDLTLYIRSNDILFGFSAVNVTNFTLMQEYVANILGLPVGTYYHIANNFHVYEEHVPRIKEFAELDISLYMNHPVFQYEWNPMYDLEQLDEMWDGLYRWENVFFTGAYDDIPTWSSDMINDWAKVFYKHKYPDSEIDFVNPLLNHLYYETQQ